MGRLEYMRRWRAKNAEKEKVRNAKWRNANPGYAKAWRTALKEKEALTAAKINEIMQSTKGNCTE